MEKTTKEVTSSGMAATVSQIVVFKLGSEEYGLNIDQIREVVITPPITRMPQTPSFIKGVANVRGNIIAVLDLEEKFNLSARSDTAETKSNYTLVIESEDFKMGVLVKEVPNTLSISSNDIDESVLSTENISESTYVKGIVKLNKRLIILIDIFNVLTTHDLNQSLKKSAITAS